MKRIFQLLELHLDEVAIVMGEDMEEFRTLINNVLDDPVDLLPVELHCMLLYEEAFREAVRCGLLSVRKGRVVLNRFPIVLYAYLFGRLFADDYTERVRGRVLWASGSEIFPATDLQRYFRVKNLKQIRGNNIGKKVPRNHQIVDNLFV